MIEALSKLLTLRNLLLLALVIGIIACLPFIKDELLLQFRCHLNESHLAHENLRLTAEMKRVRNEMKDMRERVQLSRSDADIEHSRANRSYWKGVWNTVLIIFTMELAVGMFISYICCKCLAARTSQRQVAVQRHAEW